MTKTKGDNMKVFGASIAFILFVIVSIAISGAFFGWLIMLGAGILGHSMPFIPDAWALGAIVGLIIGAITK